MYRIPCPACGKRLKVKDPAFIGRKAQCPQCSHRFVLTLPQEQVEEVKLTLAEPPVTAAPAVTEQPLVGTSARWVPDEPVGIAAEPTEQPESFDFAQPATSRVAEIRSRRRTNKRTGWVLGAIGAVLIAGVGTAAYMAADNGSSAPKTVVQRNKQWEDETKSLRESAQSVQDVSPTNGGPIDYRYVPDGAQIVFHLRPSALWSKDESMRELVFAMGPRLGKWLSDQVTKLSGFQPAEIEQLTVCVGLGPRDSEPEISAIVQLHEAQKRSVMVRQRFRGQRDLDLNADIYVGEERAWLLVDEKTFSVGPAHLASDMVNALNAPAEPCDDLRLLLSETDQDRHITLLVDRSALEIHTDALLGEQLRPAVVQFTDWLGKHVDSVAISMHFGEKLFLETLLRNGTGTTPAKLNRAVRAQLDELPADVLKMVRFMRPRRKGQRRMIARFPAMTKAVALATDSGIGDRFVQLTTLLPERAIPNLVVGTVLTWDESTRTDFDREVKTPASRSKPELPKTLAGRLAMEIELEFKDTPLQEAFGFLGEEIGVTFSMDGDAIKLAGLTKNMKQTVNLGKVPAHKILGALLAQRPPLALVADEAGLSFRVTTPPAVEAAGETMYEVPK